MKRDIGEALQPLQFVRQLLADFDETGTEKSVVESHYQSIERMNNIVVHVFDQLTESARRIEQSKSFASSNAKSKLRKKLRKRYSQIKTCQDLLL